MRLKPQGWFVISLLLFAAAFGCWQLGNRYASRPAASPTPAATTPAPAHPPITKTAAAKSVTKRKSYRLANTTQPMAQLLHNGHALILRNALIDTERPVPLKIPDHLRAKGAPGSYLVQADRPLDGAFYSELQTAGAAYVSYIPNNAALVKATPEQATNLAQLSDVVAVLPYEPYYKLDSTLLPMAVEQEPQTNNLCVTTFPGQRDAALAALTQLGATLIGEDTSPFGPTLVVQVPSNSLTAVAQMPLAQEVEVYSPRRLMNDLTRQIMGEAPNTLIGTPTYLNLSGAGVTVNINDSGVQAGHPDLTNRVLGDKIDGNGHGTHVAGIIGGTGKESLTISGIASGSVANASFAGKATNVTLYSQSLDLVSGPFVSDGLLQQNASVHLGPTNHISNNSWDYGSTTYDTHAASYDAATRDAQPGVDGEQPLLFVFAAGDGGNSQGNVNSPGLAKNVITVGASDSPRYITNLVSEDGVATNMIWYADTASTNTVASFSSCGNVDVGSEGLYGRFKPDVVAPGVFTVSCRTSDYIDPTNSVIVEDVPAMGQVIGADATNYYIIFLPDDPAGYSASGLSLVISTNASSPYPFPDLTILADDNPPNFLATTIVATNVVYTVPQSQINPGDYWLFGIAKPTNVLGPVNYNIDFYVSETNFFGDYYVVLSNMNYPLQPYYVYQSGTSMSAGAVSGTLALMQQFLQSSNLDTNPSPALLKAMLINGSRSLGLPYDLNVETEGPNEQGWGLPNIASCLPASLANSNPSMRIYDQSTTNALATGQYETYSIDNSDSNFLLSPIRITLVWTDPPGNPAAGVELVNNLELTVSDNSGTNIYFGNDFLSGDTFTESSNPTNIPGGQSDNDVLNVYWNQGGPNFTSAGDTINNVQNVYIDPTTTPVQLPLTITISGTRINVNAATLQTNSVLQDYALVISSDDSALTAPITVGYSGIQSASAPLITMASNGVPLLHERVGANEPNLYNYLSGQTNGSMAQWHFFIFTNSELSVSNTTNVAFATFLPPNLAIPRASGSADVDLYVYAPLNALSDFYSFLQTPANFTLFASSPNTLNSTSRTGTQSVIFTNSTVPVYYIGVKSEDQQASDFGFYGVAQNAPFSTSSGNGSTITAKGTSLPVLIPNAVSLSPALAFAFMVPSSGLNRIRDAIVTLGVQYGNPSSLDGVLAHDQLKATLDYFTGPAGGFTNTFDDLNQNPKSGSIPANGPGKLTQYINQLASGVWMLTMANSFLANSPGYITQYTVTADLQQPSSGFFISLGAGDWYDSYVDVPNDTTNMIIYASYENEPGTTNGTGSGPIGIYETNQPGQILDTDYGTNNIVAPGGFLALSTNNPVPGWLGAPPLSGGYWYYGIYNAGTAPVSLYVQIVFQESLTPNVVQTYSNNAYIPLTTDAHTQSQICITNSEQLVDLDVGLCITDTNLDDLVIHLTSPQGTSVLLFEDRGGLSANELGLQLITTNGLTNYSTNYVYTYFTEDATLATVPIKFAPPPYAENLIVPAATLWSNSFETVADGVYAEGTNSEGIYTNVEGWIVTNNVVTGLSNGVAVLETNDEVGIVTDPNGEFVGSNSLGTNYLALTSGRILQTFGVTNPPFTSSNGFNIVSNQPYELVFYARPFGLSNWWPANNNATDLAGGQNGTISNYYTTNVTTNSTNIVATPYANYATGEVQEAFGFAGNGLSATNDYVGNEVDFGSNAGNFGTNNFTVEFWIRQPSNATGLYGVLEKRAECNADFSMWDIHSGPITGWGPTPPAGTLDWEVTDNGGVNLFHFYSTTNINDGNFHHAAFVRFGTSFSIYIDGQLNTNETSSGIANLSNSMVMRAGQSVCVPPGIDGIDAGEEPFVGDIDELSLYSRALSPAEIHGIYAAGSVGKFNTNSLLPNFTLTIDGVETNTITLTNFSGGWELITNTFYASNNQVTIEFAGNPMGVLLDDIQLIQLPYTNHNNYFLPEEPMSPFVGENPYGCWTLDISDTRLDSSQPYNGSLLSWTLETTTSSTNATLNVLTDDVPFTDTNLTPNSIAYFAVDVPSYATYATNILTANNGAALTLLFDQTALPTGGLPGDFTLAAGVQSGTPSTTLLTTLGAPPPLIPGQRYFLGVLNDGPGLANFTIQVNFNFGTNYIIPLTNTIAFTNTVGTVNPTGTPQYYSFRVPNDAELVTFQVLNATGEVDMYAHMGQPVPGPLLFDYESCDAANYDQYIAITTNSVPVALPQPPTNPVIPIGSNTWFVAANNFALASNLNYTIIATYETSNDLQIIPLTNGVPYTNTAAPGYDSSLFYSFTVTNSPTAVQFMVTNLTNAGNVQLLANLNHYPTPQQYYEGSFNSGTNAQVIEIFVSSSLTNLDGVWYLSVPNTSTTNVPYLIEATTNVLVNTNLPAKTSLTWNGLVNGAPDGNWDIGLSSNWLATSNLTIAEVYQNGVQVTFDDNAKGTRVVDLTTLVLPTNVVINNTTPDYQFIGNGYITGAPLSLNNYGTLIVDNGPSNSFTSVSITGGGTLQIGNGDENGSLATTGGILGAGTFNTGNGILAVARTDNITLTNILSGSGGLTQLGPDTLTVTGTNTFTGAAQVEGGTLLPKNTNALGAGIGDVVFAETGGTLDLGGISVPAGYTNPLFDGKTFIISGSGVGGNGAIVNNGTNQLLGAIEQILLGSPSSIGGDSRWDIRPGSANFAELEIGNSTLTKTGTNQINIVGSSDTFILGGANAHILIDEGILSIQGAPDFLSPLTITTESNGLFGQLSNNFNSLPAHYLTFILDGGGITNLTGGGVTYLDAPITLETNSSIENGAGVDIFDGIISGSGGFTNFGPGINLLTATNTYTGATVVASGTLGLTNTGSISNSANITVAAGATLSATGRTDQTLGLLNGQTLIDYGAVVAPTVAPGPGSALTVAAGGQVTGNVQATGATVTINGDISGSTAANSGSLVSGSGAMSGSLTLDNSSSLVTGSSNTIGTLTVGSSATLGLLTYMKIDPGLSPAQSNDVLLANRILFGGSLVVTNLDTTDPYYTGESFQLFKAASSSGAFSSMALPPLPYGLYWTNNFAANGGTLSILGLVPTLNLIYSGTNLIFSGADGFPGAEFLLLGSPSLTLPYSEWTVISTNYLNAQGAYSITNAFPTNNPYFYILESPP